MNTPTPSIATNQHEPLPDLKSAGGPVTVRQFVERGTGSAVFLGYFAAAFAILIGGVFTYGILWLALLLAPVADYFNRKKAMALLRGSGVEVTEQQLPELHSCVVNFAQRLGMRIPPTVFIVEGSMLNAMATRIGGRKVVVLIDDIVDACLRSGEPQALAFILAHEMAHHALGHTGLVRTTLTQSFKKLARLDEFSCDAVANQLVGNPQVSARALITLLSGPQLLRFLNLEQLASQADHVAADRNSVKAERKLSHPLILRRIKRFF